MINRNSEQTSAHALAKLKKLGEEKFIEERTKHEQKLELWEHYLFSKELEILFDAHKKNKNRKEINPFILKLIFIIDALKFFPKKENLDKLKEYGIKNEVFRFMISIDEIKIKLDEINQNNYIHVCPGQSMLLINDYLMYKIGDVVQNNYGFITNKKGNQKTKINSGAAFWEALRRSHNYFQKNGKDIPVKTVDDNEIHKLILDFPPDTNPYKLIETALKGDLHYETIKPLFYEPISVKLDESIKVTDFYFTYYPLLRLLMPNKILSISEFEAKAYLDTRSFKNYFYTDIIKTRFHVS